MKSLKTINVSSLLSLKKTDEKLPSKTTINLAMTEKKEKSPHETAKKAAIIAVIALIVLKFGAYDQYRKIANAQKEYNELHRQNVEMQTKLESYNKVLNEYRAYSTDWMKATVSKDEVPVGVDRADVLELIETEILPKGEISFISINSIEDGKGDDKATIDVLSVTMDVSTLQESSDILAAVRKNPLVARAELGLAHGRNTSGEVAFSMTVKLKPKNSKKK